MNLIEAMQTEYSRCKWWLYRIALPINALAVCSSIASAFNLDTGVAITLAMIAFVAQAGIFAIKELLAAPHQERAEKIRRLAMLQDGLGEEPSPNTLAQIKEQIGELKNGEPPYIGEYYTSQEEVGYRRLLDITSESAFYTASSARRLSRTLFWAAGLGTFLVFVLLYIVLSALSQGAIAPEEGTLAQSIAKISLIIFAAVGLGQMTSAALGFHALATSARMVNEQCESALSSGASKKAMMTWALTAFTEYNCAVSKAAPIPSLAYRWNLKNVDAAWRLRRSGLTGP